MPFIRDNCRYHDCIGAINICDVKQGPKPIPVYLEMETAGIVIHNNPAVTRNNQQGNHLALIEVQTTDQRGVGINTNMDTVNQRKAGREENMVLN
jgi:hypothetical protein